MLNNYYIYIFIYKDLVYGSTLLIIDFLIESSNLSDPFDG